MIHVGNGGKPLTISSKSYRDESDVKFAYLGFSDGAVTVPFQEAEAYGHALVIQKEEAIGGPASDFQGAFVTAVDFIESDMAALSDDARESAHYRVVVFSDDAPEPRCRRGCDDSEFYRHMQHGY
jgi:hypothetical protein